jgi:PPOX class probable F420-dependent enzyme
MNFPEKYLDLLKPETRAYLYLATTMPDFSPQLTPVWFDNDGEHILINTSEGRVKARNMKEHSKVAVVIQDPSDPFRYLGIRGEVVSYTREGGDEHIDMLSRRYTDKPWNYRPEQKRIIFKIRPDHFDEH